MAVPRDKTRMLSSFSSLSPLPRSRTAYNWDLLGECAKRYTTDGTYSGGNDQGS